MNFKNKTIWITGASSGIGEALAIEWSKFHPNLIISARNIEKLTQIKSICEQNGAICTVVKLDLTDPSTIDQATKEVFNTYNAVDILVNNGGISQRSLAIETDISIDRKVFETNFWGTVYLTKSVLPYMSQNKSGHIVAISSITGKFGFPLRTAYSASKHALQGFFDSLRAEMAAENINVTVVSPGRISTNISLNAIDKDGKSHGVMDNGQANGMPANKCAQKIIKAVSKNKKDILVGNKELLMVYIHKWIPALYYKLASKINPT